MFGGKGYRFGNLDFRECNRLLKLLFNIIRFCGGIVRCVGTREGTGMGVIQNHTRHLRIIMDNVRYQHIILPANGSTSRPRSESVSLVNGISNIPRTSQKKYPKVFSQKCRPLILLSAHCEVWLWVTRSFMVHLTETKGWETRDRACLGDSQECFEGL